MDEPLITFKIKKVNAISWILKPYWINTRDEKEYPQAFITGLISSVPILTWSYNKTILKTGLKDVLCILAKLFEFKEIKNLSVWFEKRIWLNIFFYWNSCSQVFYRLGAVKNCTKFTAKRLCWRSATLVRERLRHRYFSVNLAKFLKTHFSKNNYDDCLCIYFFKK